MVNLVNTEDYKEVIHAHLSENKGKTKGYQTRMAAEANCQKSHFSLVLRGHHHLSPEQALKLADFWGYSETESEYFVCLVELAKTNCQRYAERCRNRLHSLRQKIENLSKRFNVDSLGAEFSTQYYGRWEFQAIHALTATEMYSSADKISERLNIPVNSVHQFLNELERMKCIRKTANGWHAESKNIHLGDSSPLNWVNHYHWRQRAITKCQNNNPNNIHFSAIYALSENDKQHLKTQIYELLDTSRAIATESQEEDVVVFTCDWYSI